MCNGPTAAAATTMPSASSEENTSVTTTTPSKFITRREIQNHNSPSDAWCSVHGTVIDITEFAKHHPGGDIILLAAGKDATTLVETYHPRGYPNKTIQKLKIGQLERNDDEIKESFYSWNESDFYTVLKQRVLQRLKDKGLNRRGSTEIWIKALIILFGFWFSLYKMYTTPFTHACYWSISMGVWAHFVGTCIQHDGNHGAFAVSSFWNKVAGWTLDMIGASGFTWEIQHMLGHHPYTNVLDTDANTENYGDDKNDQESDPDVFSSFPLVRMHPELDEPEWYHAYQHYYAPILFAFMTIAKVLQQDFEIVFTHKLYHIDAHCRYGDTKNVLRFWFMKVITTIYMVVIPCYVHGIKGGLTLFFLGHLTCGEVLATMFIVNHVIEGVAYAKKGSNGLVTDDSTDIGTLATDDSSRSSNSDDDSSQNSGTATTNFQRPQTVHGNTPMLDMREMEQQQQKNTKNRKQHKPVPLNDWAAVQCQTSVNWSVGSWFWNHFSGGLCHQIEHHLFPSLCHTHYVYISDVVKETCEEYGVPYQHEPSLYVAYGKMLKHLATLGKPTQPKSTKKSKME